MWRGSMQNQVISFCQIFKDKLWHWVHFALEPSTLKGIWIATHLVLRDKNVATRCGQGRGRFSCKNTRTRKCMWIWAFIALLPWSPSCGHNQVQQNLHKITSQGIGLKRSPYAGGPFSQDPWPTTTPIRSRLQYSPPTIRCGPLSIRYHTACEW